MVAQLDPHQSRCRSWRDFDGTKKVMATRKSQWYAKLQTKLYSLLLLLLSVDGFGCLICLENIRATKLPRETPTKRSDGLVQNWLIDWFSGEKQYLPPITTTARHPPTNKHSSSNRCHKTPLHLQNNHPCIALDLPASQDQGIPRESCHTNTRISPTSTSLLLLGHSGFDTFGYDESITYLESCVNISPTSAFTSARRDGQIKWNNYSIGGKHSGRLVDIATIEVHRRGRRRGCRWA